MNMQPRPVGFEWCQFSAEWTAEDKLKLIALMSQVMHADINDGRYSETGRPNCASITDVITASTEELESTRGWIDQMIETYAKESDSRRVHVPVDAFS